MLLSIFLKQDYSTEANYKVLTNMPVPHKLIIIYHDFLPPPRMSGHIKSDNTQSSTYTP